MNSLMIGLLEYFNSNCEANLHSRLMEVRFVTTLTEDAIVVLIYNKPLMPTWEVEAEKLAAHLNVKIIGRSRKLKKVVGGSEIVEEILSVHGRSIKYYQTEGAFSQPNAKVCEKMLEWSLDATSGSEEHDLLELYCGGGTFTAALASNFRKVLATEISKASVDLAMQAFKANAIENVKIARLSSEDFTAAFTGTRKFQRLEDAKIDLKTYDIRTVLVDPPRAGLDAATCALLCRFEKIVYISCNPVTLARDIAMMSASHSVVRVAAFDQFPYTKHLESGVILMRKEGFVSADSAHLDTVSGSLIEEVRKIDGTDADEGVEVPTHDDDGRGMDAVKAAGGEGRADEGAKAERANELPNGIAEYSVSGGMCVESDANDALIGNLDKESMLGKRSFEET